MIDPRVARAKNGLNEDLLSGIMRITRLQKLSIENQLEI